MNCLLWPDDCRYITLLSGSRQLISQLEGSVRYDSLLVNGRKVKMADNGANNLNYSAYCSIKGFWQYAKEKLMKFHGVSGDRLPLYLKEVEFRWLHRNGEFFDLVTESICEYNPESIIHKPEPTVYIH